MAGGYNRVPQDGMDEFVERFKEINRRLRELEAPSGTQIYGAVAKVKEAIDSIGALVDAYLASGFTTGSMTATGDVTVGGLIRNVSAYSNSLTSGFRNLFVTNVDGQFGFNLSSREFKQDIEPAEVAPADVLKLRLVTYRYIQAVETFGEEAAREYGFIAEEVEEAGLGWLVDYDEETGKPLTLKFHLIAMAMLVVAQDQERRLVDLERRR